MKHLDARQRAMLAEMGVTVWEPEAGADVPVVGAASVAPPPSSPPPPPVARSEAVPDGAAVLSPVFRDRVAGVPGMDWPALQAAVSGCEACGLCRTRTQTVFGVGPAADGAAPPRVDWLVVGEAPGENEDRQGEPFVGQAGKLLDHMLAAIGLHRRGEQGRAGAYILNVLKCRPPGNRNPTPEEMAQCAPFLERQVELLQPRIILATGRFAVQALLHETVPDVATQPLGRLRGRVHHYRGVPVLVTYHPAYLLRTPADKAKAWADLCLALATAQAASR